MSSKIYNKSGSPVSKSANLRGLLRAASLYKGVTKIEVKAIQHTTPGGPAWVNVHYVNGYTGETEFVCHDHAVKWAIGKSMRPASYWTGCDVVAPDAVLSPFERAYLTCALWSSNDESDDSGGVPMNDKYDIDDIAPECKVAAMADCRDFQHANRALLKRAYALYVRQFGKQYAPEEMAGHDFWLTRNRHGAGFWDRGLGTVGDKLSDAAKAYGGIDLYVGDDGKIYA